MGVARDFRESVAYSAGIFGDQVANLFYYHARQNYSVDPSQLPQGVDKFDQALRSLLGTGAIVVVRECAKRLAAVLGVRIERSPDNMSSLYQESLRELQAREVGAYTDGLIAHYGSS